MLDITPETLETMSQFNTLTGFMLCMVLWILIYANFIYQIAYLIFNLGKFIVGKIKKHNYKKKGTDVDAENTHTEH